jgi:putative membrane protein
VFSQQDIHDFILTFLYSGVGMLVFSVFFLIIVKIAPFPVVKEIEEDQNVALAILVGAVMIGLSIIIAAAIV